MEFRSIGLSRIIEMLAEDLERVLVRFAFEDGECFSDSDQTVKPVDVRIVSSVSVIVHEKGCSVVEPCVDVCGTCDAKATVY